LSEGPFFRAPRSRGAAISIENKNPRNGHAERDTPSAAAFHRQSGTFGRDLTKQRAISQTDAAEKRQAITIGNLRGQSTLWTAAQICGAFLTPMAFFLLIAIERDQRRSAAALVSGFEIRRLLPLAPERIAHS